MCGRYVITNAATKTNKIVKSAIQIEDTENYNAHPYQKLPVIKRYKNGNTLEKLKWGIIPSWSKKKDFKPLINARLETIDEKISFKKSEPESSKLRYLFTSLSFNITGCLLWTSLTFLFACSVIKQNSLFSYIPAI